jgi:hypothetical protein
VQVWHTRATQLTWQEKISQRVLCLRLLALAGAEQTEFGEIELDKHN